MDMHPLCGHTFDRSTSAYASKKRSRRTMHKFERGVQIDHPGTLDVDREISDSHLVHKLVKMFHCHFQSTNVSIDFL